ncbi:hypothetical protein FRC05_002003 [Tulasnella sp. 425]|nr:hypothetical protein FRC05_002003 [Tulasnella sp. 425]
MSCLLFNLAIEPLAESLRRSQLKGIRVPGLMNRLICKLFADDTQLYLSRQDNFGQAMIIAERWCLASTAKFNKAKTEILPMGTPEYRRAVVQTRSLRPEQRSTDPFLEGARIYKDGEHLHILGGRVGHKIDTDTVWDSIISNMEVVATKWATRNMTFQGRKLVINFIILSRAQFFLMTNLPTVEITKKITSLTRNFIWTGKLKNAIRLDILMRPREEGGLGIPDFEARVIAVKLALICKWTLPVAQRPDWAAVLNKLLIKASLAPNDSRLSNMLYQEWREKRGHTSKLSPGWRDVLKKAYDYNVRVDGMKFNSLAKAGVPVWLSLMNETTWKEENSGEMRHLHKNHGVMNQGDLERIPQIDRTCKDHEVCLGAIRRLVQSTLPCFNLNVQTTTPTRAGGQGDNLDHTRNRVAENARAAKEDTAILLNPDVTHRSDIALAVRIFGELQDQRRPPAFRDVSTPNEPGLVTIYTDGSADKNGKADSKCGAGLWSPDPEYVKSRGEIAATAIALNIAPTNKELLIMTDSTFVINALNGGYKKYEDMGWLGVTNADLIQRAIYLMRRRTAKTFIQKVKAHAGIPGNENADALAKAALHNETEDEISTRVPDSWKLNGARLSQMTFHDLYTWVAHLRKKNLPERS